MCLLRGQKPCRGSNTIDAWKQNPLKWEKFLTYSSPLKQPRCYLNDLILLSNQNHGRINTSSRYNGGQKNMIPLWQVLSKELCYIRILLLITVLFMTDLGLSLHYPPSPPSNVSIQTRLISPQLIFLHLCCVNYFKFLFLFYLILFLSFQNSTLFGVGGGRSVNSFTHWKGPNTFDLYFNIYI